MLLNVAIVSTTSKSNGLKKLLGHFLNGREKPVERKTIIRIKDPMENRHIWILTAVDMYTHTQT